MRMFIVILELFMFPAVAMSWHNVLHKCIATYKTMHLSQTVELTIYKHVPWLV